MKTGHSATDTARGSIQVFLAEALLLPTGLVTAAVLTRTLGPEGYGLFTLASTVIAWLAWSTNSMLSRPSIKLVSETDDWQPIATVVVRNYAICGTLAAAAVWIGAGAFASLLATPDLAFYLRLFAVELVVFALAQAHASVLVARGRFGGRAAGSAARWSVRMVLMVVLVSTGLSVSGAILGSIGGFVIELVVYRRFVRPSLLARSRFDAGRLWSYGAPLMVFEICMRLFNRMDLLALKAFGGTVADAGFYGAAQNLSIAPALVAISFSPLLLGTLTRMWSDGRREQARAMTVDSMRFVIGLLAFGAAGAGVAGELVVLLFGPEFASTAPILARLLFAEVALVIVSINTSVLIVAGRLGWISRLGMVFVLSALVGHALAIPRFGAVGAATVTLVLAVAGAIATCVAVFAAWGVRPPAATLIRTIVVSVLAYLVTTAWPTPGLAVVAKLGLVSLGIPVMFFLMGEVGPRERALAHALRRQLSRMGRSV